MNNQSNNEFKTPEPPMQKRRGRPPKSAAPAFSSDSSSQNESPSEIET